MRSYKTFGLATLIIAVFTAFTLQAASAEEGRIVKGTLVFLDESAAGMVINTEVFGLMGPQKRDVLLMIDKDVKLSICWAGDCDTGPAWEGLKLLKDFEYFEAEGLSATGRDVTVYYDAVKTDKIAHLRIDYPDTAVSFAPYDYISPF